MTTKTLPVLNSTLSSNSNVENVRLSDYDVIAISSSGGKDSQAMIDMLVKKADDEGLSRDRLVVIHSDLGRVEWAGTKELAEEQARFYGLRFLVVSRIGTVSNGVSKSGTPLYAKGEVRGDILDQVEHRAAQMKALGKSGPAWMSPVNRWCTSDHKRGPIGGAHTALAKEWQAENGKSRPCRILDCIGLRAEESSARAKKENLVSRTRTRTQHVDSWLPIQDWTTEQVWAAIKASGCPHHKAYDLGMPRLSCVFCIYAPKAALLIAGSHNRELLSEYVRVEKETGYTFMQETDLGAIEAELEAGAEIPTTVEDWEDCGA